MVAVHADQFTHGAEPTSKYIESQSKSTGTMSSSVSCGDKVVFLIAEDGTEESEACAPSIRPLRLRWKSCKSEVERDGSAGRRTARALGPSLRKNDGLCASAVF